MAVKEPEKRIAITIRMKPSVLKAVRVTAADCESKTADWIEAALLAAVPPAFKKEIK